MCTCSTEVRSPSCAFRILHAWHHVADPVKARGAPLDHLKQRGAMPDMVGRGPTWSGETSQDEARHYTVRDA